MSPTDNAAVTFFRVQVRDAHRLLEGAMADVTNEQAHWIPPGTANPLGATYAHILMSEDAAMNGMIAGGAPLFAGAFAGRTGVGEPPPAPDPAKPGFPDWSAWGRRVKIDVPTMRIYAESVYDATDKVLATLSDADLGRPVDLSALGLGRSTLGFLLGGGILGNALTHCGEIACLKGLGGKRGYPF